MYIFQLNSEHATIKTSDTERTRFASMPQIGMSGVLQVGVRVLIYVYILSRLTIVSREAKKKQAVRT